MHLYACARACVCVCVCVCVWCVCVCVCVCECECVSASESARACVSCAWFMPRCAREVHDCRLRKHEAFCFIGFCAGVSRSTYRLAMHNFVVLYVASHVARNVTRLVMPWARPKNMYARRYLLRAMRLWFWPLVLHLLLRHHAKNEPDPSRRPAQSLLPPLQALGTA
jgi:hypothetical protein